MTAFISFHFIAELFLIGLFGLITGGFLNIIAHHLPYQIMQNWRAQCEAYLNSEKLSITATQNHLHFLQWRLQCRHCAKSLPLQKSFVWLNLIYRRNACEACHHSISLYNFMMEVSASLLFILIFYTFGLNVQCGLFFIFASCLLLLTHIDLRHYLVPDIITLPLIWFGLLIHTFGAILSTETAILGAVFGYTVLWTVNMVFKHFRRIDGIGHGDMKLLAALGAWLGASALLPILLIASGTGMLFGLVMGFRKKQSATDPLPFAPFLVLGGLIQIVF